MLVVLGVATAVFAILHLSGDPLAALLPPGSSPEQEAALRAHYGLDQSLPAQYARFVSSALRGDFGDSWRTRQPALGMVLERLPSTLELAGIALAFTLAIGITVGVTAAGHRGGWVDFAALAGSAAGQSIPSFVLGTLLILLVAVRLDWLPASGGEGWKSVILPAITLAAWPAAITVRLVRDAMLEVGRADYIRTAQAKGLRERTITLRHALPNALLPAIAWTGVQAGFLVAGAVTVEWVFAYPGIGQLALQSVGSRDIPVVLAFVIVAATLIVLVETAADLLVAWLDPSLRSEAGGSR